MGKKKQKIIGLNKPLPTIPSNKQLPIINRWGGKETKQHKKERMKLQKQLEAVWLHEDKHRDTKKYDEIKKTRPPQDVMTGNVEFSVPVNNRDNAEVRVRGMFFESSHLDVRYFKDEEPTNFGNYIEVNNLLDFRDAVVNAVDELVFDILPRKHPDIFK